MFCTYCKATRPENEAPCPNCGAPSSLLGKSPTGSWGTSAATWGNQVQQVPFQSSQQWGNVAQMPFNTTGSAANWNNPAMQPNNEWDSVQQMPFNQSGPLADWGTSNQSAEQPVQDFSKALVPVPSQIPQSMQPQETAYPIIQAPTLEQLLPTLPEDSVYVPPIYTKPRPLIPRYRIISGLLSLLIVGLAVCGGLSYYAKASGTLDRISSAFNGTAARTSAQTTTIVNLPDPKKKPDYGPALAQIPSATLAASVDKNLTPQQPTQFFKVNQEIHLTCSIPPSEQGTVSAKWYMNGNYFQPTHQDIKKDPAKTTNVDMTMAYGTAAEGVVELYWNDKLAQKLYFVVKP